MYYIHALIVFLTVGSASAWADCKEEPRQVELAKGDVVSLRTYLCRTENVSSGPQIRVEFQRFSDFAASLIVAHKSTVLLQRAIGRPKLIENDVFRTYADMLREEGITTSLRYEGGKPRGLSLRLEAPRQDGLSASDVFQEPTVKTLLGDIHERGGDYPAVDEVSALRQRNIPRNLSFFYTVQCEDEPDDPERPICRKYELSKAEVTFWRPLTLEDITNYGANATKYNSMMKRKKENLASTNVPHDLRLVQYIARGSLPDDFMWLVGSYGTCGGEFAFESTGVTEFAYSPREPIMDAIVIKNVSQQTIRIDGLAGLRTSTTRLRPSVDLPRAPISTNLADDTSVTLIPDESILIPTRIKFVLTEDTKRPFGHRQTASNIFRQIGIRDFTGNTTAHAAPPFRDYLYGPEIVATGVIVNGKQIEFGGRSANFVEITISAGDGSCPYLLSYGRDGWTSHGKVLDQAKTKLKEATQVLSFPGFVNRFRLEEREPESAYIHKAELVVVLKNHSTVIIKSSNKRLVGEDGEYFGLNWGEMVEFEFPLPSMFSPEDVVESRLLLTGYYERYSAKVSAIQKR